MCLKPVLFIRILQDRLCSLNDIKLLSLRKVFLKKRDNPQVFHNLVVFGGFYNNSRLVGKPAAGFKE